MFLTECVPGYMLVEDACEYRCDLGRVFNFNTSQCDECPEHSTTTEVLYTECRMYDLWFNHSCY